MIALLDVERIKLFSTRAVWWCIALAVVATLGMSTLADSGAATGSAITVADSQVGAFVGQLVFMVLAVMSVSGEHRYGTIRLSYLSTPKRWQVLLAKAGTLGLIGLVSGLVLAFTSLGLAKLLYPEADLALNGLTEWRHVAGAGLVYPVGVVIGVAIGSLLRHAGGAVSLLLLWILLVETLVATLPYGEVLLALMPFQAQAYFAGQLDADFPYPPTFGIVYAAGVAVLLLGLAMVVSERRDAA